MLWKSAVRRNLSYALCSGIHNTTILKVLNLKLYFLYIYFVTKNSVKCYFHLTNNMLPSSQNMKSYITSGLGINELALSNKSKLNILLFYVRWVTMWLRRDQSKHYILLTRVDVLRWAHDLCWPIRLNPSNLRMNLDRSSFFTASHECQRNWWWNFFRQLCTSIWESGPDTCVRVKPAQGETDVRENLVLMTSFELPKLSFSEFSSFHGCSPSMIL